MGSAKNSTFGIMVFSIVLFLFGVASLSIGIFVLARRDQLFSLINLLDGQIAADRSRQEINAVASQAGPIVNSAILLITAGFLAILTCCCGCWAAIRESSKHLYTFAGLIALILIFNISVAALAGTLQSRIGSGAQQSWLALQESYFVSIDTYESTNGTQQDNLAAMEAVTRLINLVHVSFDCCGATEVNDVSNSSSWLSSNLNWWRGGVLVNPMTCCRLLPGYKSTVMSPAFNWTTIDSYLMDHLCPFTSHSASLHSKVCPGSLVDYSGSFTNPMLGFSIVMILLLTLGLFVCCWFAIAMKFRPDCPVLRRSIQAYRRRHTSTPDIPAARPAVSGVQRAPGLAMNSNSMASRADSAAQRQSSTVNGRRDTPAARPAVSGVDHAPVQATAAYVEPLRPVKVSPQTR